MTSKKFSLNWIDAGKGFLMAVVAAALYFIQDSLDKGTVQFHWKSVGMAAVSGGVGYLIKNYFSNPLNKKPGDESPG